MTDTARWESKIVGLRKADPTTLVKHPDNFRRHPPEQVAALRDAIDRAGYHAPVIVNVRTGHLIDGHLRAEQAAIAGVEIDVIDVDLDPDEERYALATHDPVAAMAVADVAAHAALIRDLDIGAATAAMFAVQGLAAGPVPDFAPATEAEQGRLDQIDPIICPQCGHQFHRS